MDEKDDVKIESESENLDDSVVAEKRLAETIKKLHAKLKVCEKEKQEYLDGWQRERAQFVNWRKQDEKEKREFEKYANESLVTELLSVLDNFERATEPSTNTDPTRWKEGVLQTIQLFKSALEQNGLTEINPLGETYNPLEHDAVGSVEVDDKSKDNKVFEVFAKGYVLKGKTIRAPKVRVGEFKKSL